MFYSYAVPCQCQVSSLTPSIDSGRLGNIKRESCHFTRKPQVNSGSSFGAPTFIKSYANLSCEFQVNYEFNVKKAFYK